MAIVLAETFIALGTAIERCRELGKCWRLFTDAICLQPAVVAIVAIGIKESFSYPCCFGIGMDISERVKHSPMVFGVDRR